jgi:hypothetical protein
VRRKFLVFGLEKKRIKGSHQCICWAFVDK